MTPRQQKKGWESFKVDSSFDNTFEGWSDSRKQQCTVTLNKPNLVLNAKHIMKKIRMLICHRIREWYENYQYSTTNLNITEANQPLSTPQGDAIHSLKAMQNRLEHTLSRRLED